MKSVYRGFTDPGEKSHRERELERLLVLAYHRGNVAILVAAFFAVWKLVPMLWDRMQYVPPESRVDAAVVEEPMHTMKEEVYEIYLFVVPVDLWWMTGDDGFDPATIGRAHHSSTLPTMIDDVVGVCNRRGRCLCPAAHTRMRAFRPRPVTWRSNNAPSQLN